jgi:uridylate kinase
LLKLSGEAFQGGPSGPALDASVLAGIGSQLRKVHELGVEVGVVVGGGNIFRGGGAPTGFGRTTGDYMGMLATLVNSLALQATLESQSLDARVMSAFAIPAMAEPFVRRRAIRHLELKRIVIYGGGTGNPYFTTDSAAALRASETDCDLLLKATKVDGVYSTDPMKDPNARRYDRLSFQEAIARRLRVMDTTAFSLCRENGIPIVVFNFFTEDEIVRVLLGEAVGTRIDNTDASRSA